MATKQTFTVQDKGWAWVVVLGVSLNFMVYTGFVRGFGVYYAALVDEYGSSATVTSLIQGFRFGALCIMSPIASCLTERYTERAVLMAGSLIFSLALILSYFAPNLEFNVLTLGVMTGVAMAFSNAPAQIAIGKYFDRHRSLANSITWCGASLGVMFVPPFVMYLVHQYGLKGSFLIYGALLLNLLVGGAVVRPFKGHNSAEVIIEMSDGNEGKEKCVKNASVSQERRRNLSDSQRKDMYKHNLASLPTSVLIPWDDSDSDLPSHLTAFRVSHTDDRLTKSQEITRMTPDNGTNNSPSSNIQTPLRTSKDTEVHRGLHKNAITTPKSDEELSNVRLYTSYASLPCLDGSIIISECRESEGHTSDWYLDKASTSGKQGCGAFIKSVIDFTLFRDVRFVLLLASTGLGMVSFTNVTIYLIPRAEEYGVSRDRAALLLTIAGGCDIVGRLFLGVVSDLKTIGPDKVMAAGLFLIGTGTLLLPLTDSFNTMAVYVVFFGLIGSSAHLLCLPITVLFVGTQRMPRAMGLVICFHGIASAVSPPILGYIKDTTGSYDNTFYVCGACQLLASLLLTLEPLVRWIQWKRRNAEP